jgi:hypothetical protein
MNEDILRFRKLVDKLGEKGWPMKKIQLDLGISRATLDKILHVDLQDYKIRASMLVAIQNFIKKHIDVLNGYGFNVARESEEEETDKPLIRVKPGVMEKRQRELAERGSNSPVVTFWDYLELASACVPNGMSLTLTINGKN